jgi:hypothetical protein
MEELNKTHKEEAFGWVLSVQQMMRSANSHLVRPRIVEPQPRPAAPAAPLDDLHNLAAPR